MFRKLHRQMTLFSAFITSLIILALTCICLFISENALVKNAEATFLKELNTMITHLQSQNTISLQWVNQLQENSHFLLYFYDNGKPLYQGRLYSSEAELALAAQAYDAALLNGMDISSSGTGTLPEHVEFYLPGTQEASGGDFKVSAGTIPRNGNCLGFLAISPLSGQKRQITNQRLLFAAADAMAIFLLTIFAWFFTGRMLVPLEENRKKQTDFISAASHELRAPLTVILSGAEALKKTETGEEREHFLRIIQSEGKRMQHLITDMLFLARSDSGTFPVNATPIQPDVLVLDAYEKYQAPARQKGISLSLSLPDTPFPACLCDPERMAQIFSILLDNALSYTPSGGAVTLALTENKKRGTLIFSVSDTGSGIPDDEKDKIFDRFYRSQQSHTDKNHFGLGLCIAGQIASAHHGRLRVLDSPSGGADFQLELPSA